MDVVESRTISDRRYAFPQANTSSLLWAFDHESNVRRRTLEHLEREGLGLRMIPIGPDVVRRARQLHPSLVMIETARVRGAALELCRGIRQLHSLSRTPIILLSAVPARRNGRSPWSREPTTASQNRGADERSSPACGPCFADSHARNSKLTYPWVGHRLHNARRTLSLLC